jgi:large subunit ribosomal protein L33
MGKAAKLNQIKLECVECHTINYFTRKNKKLIKDRIQLKKYCSRCGKHLEHKETK